MGLGIIDSQPLTPAGYGVTTVGARRTPCTWTRIRCHVRLPAIHGSSLTRLPLAPLSVGFRLDFLPGVKVVVELQRIEMAQEHIEHLLVGQWKRFGQVVSHLGVQLRLALGLLLPLLLLSSCQEPADERGPRRRLGRGGRRASCVVGGHGPASSVERLALGAMVVEVALWLQARGVVDDVHGLEPARLMRAHLVLAAGIEGGGFCAHCDGAGCLLLIFCSYCRVVAAGVCDGAFILRCLCA